MIDYFANIRIVSALSVAFKLVFIISGIVLFLLYLLKNRVFHKYYGILLITSILFGFVFVQPHEIEYEKEGLRFYSPYQWFIQMCCPLEVYEVKYGLLEKRLFVFNIGPVLNPQKDIEIEEGRIIRFKNYISEFDVISQSYLKRDSLVSY